MAKKYHTIDELLEQSRMKRIDNFSVGDGKGYHTVDEIREAAINQGILPQSEQTVAAPVVSAKQPKQIVTNYDPSVTAKAVNTSTNQPTVTKRPALTPENRAQLLAYQKASGYTNDTTYDDVQKDINRLKMQQGGAQRRGRDSKAYGMAIDMLKNYANQRYSQTPERTDYQKNAASTVEELQKEINQPVDLYDVDDVKRALSNIPDVQETAEWYVMYRRGGILRTDENIRKYNKITELIEQNIPAAGKAKALEESRKVAYQNEDGKKVNYHDLMAGKVAGNLKSDVESLTPDQAKDYLYDLNRGGYNAMDARKVSSQQLRSAGWDVTDGDKVNYAQAVKDDPISTDRTETAAVFSPVVYDKDGNVSRVLSPDELNEYGLSVLRGGDDHLNLQVSEIYKGQYAPSLAEVNAGRIRRLSEKAYNNTDFESLISKANNQFDDQSDLYDDTTVEDVQSALADRKAARKALEDMGVNWKEYGAYNQRLKEIEESKKAVKEYSDWSTKNGGTGTAATLANIAMSPGKAFDYIGNIIGNTIDNFRAGGNQLSVYTLPDTADDWSTNLSGESSKAITEAIRQGIRGNGDNEFINRVADIAANTYGGVTSGVQSALTIGTCYAILPPGAAEGVSLSIMSAEAANDAYHDVLDNGGTIGQATMYSVAAGVNEYIGEKLSLDHLIDLRMTFGKGQAKNILLGILKQGLVEGSEEILTENLNEFADRIINADFSQYERDIQNYMSAGMSENEAKKKASQDFYSRVLWAGYGGFVGGLLPGGGKVAVNTIQNKVNNALSVNQSGRDVYNAGNVQQLIDEGMKVDENAPQADVIKEYAQKAAKAQEKGKTGNKVVDFFNESKARKATGKLYTAKQQSNMQAAEQAYNDTQRSTIKELYAQETGTELDNDKTLQAIQKRVNHEELSVSEVQAIESDEAQNTIRAYEENRDVFQSQARQAAVPAMKSALGTAKLTMPKEQTAAATDDDVDISDYSINEDDGKTYIKGTNKVVEPRDIVGISENDVQVRLDDGSTESVKNLDLASTGDAVLVQSILDVQKELGVPLNSRIANELYQGYKSSDAESAVAYVRGAAEAIQKGLVNDTGAYSAEGYAVALPQNTRGLFYQEGRTLAESLTQEQQEQVMSRVKETNTRREGKVTFVDGVSYARLDAKRQIGVDVVSHMAKDLGFDVVFYRSTKDGKGRYNSAYVTQNKLSNGEQAPNGFWKNGTMYLDVNAGAHGQGLILFTASHELVHMMRESSPEHFKALADFLIENYAKNGVNVQDLVRAEMLGRGSNLNYDMAYEEVIAQACEEFLRDTHLDGKAEQFYRSNPESATKVTGFLARIANAVRRWYNKAVRATSYEAQQTARLGVETVERAHQLWIAGIRAASENLRNMEKPATEGGAKNQFRGFTENGYEVYETNSDLRGKSYKEKIDIFESAFYDENSPLYFGSEIRFERNGKLLYAEIDRHSKNEILYKINPSHLNQWDKAKINVGASGDFVTLMENASFDREEVNTNRSKNDAHKRTTVWEYYAKSIYVDGKPFDVVVNIRREDSGSRFVYDVKLKQNKNLPQLDPQAKISRRSKVQSTRLSGRFENNISQTNDDVKQQSRDADYLSAVERGDMETAQRMVDEAAKAAGYDRHLYHGSKRGGGFTVFKGWQYFTENKPYAERYARQDTGEGLYDVYVKSDKLFDTRKAADRAVFEQYRDEYGMTELQKSGLPDWTDGYDLSDIIEENDLDYDGIVLDEGGDLVNGKPVSRGPSYVIRNSEQIKSADPVTYDDNGDVIPLSERFNESNKDIRFSLRDNVEETRDLIAVHNLTEEKLLKSLSLGGLPMPSIAVIKAETGHKGYGDISIVFPKETIDPSKNRSNKLYGGDVWSPTYPSIDYEVDTKKANNIYTRAREALRKPAAYRLNPVTFHPENIADRINSYGGEQGFIEHYKNDYGMKQFYLAEQDQAVSERYVEKQNEISDVDKEFYSFIADQLGKEAFSQEATKTGREWNTRYADDLDNARIDYMRSVYGELSKEEEENLRRDFESERRVQKFRIARSVQGYLENGGVTVERKLDEDGIKADIDKLVDQSKYEEWLKELFNGIEKSSGIYNGTDYYTSSGNRRSFAQTHYTETLANVVRVMKSQDNGDSFFGGNGLWAIAAKNYGTIEEMKADKDRLTNLSDEERQEISNRFGERFTEIASSIANDGDNEFLALDNAYGNICDAVRNTNTKSGLLRELQTYHHKATVATVDDILDLVSDVGNMPVNYFEAKPQRAIKFNEVSTAVIPDNASQALRTALDNAGVKYIEYAAGNEEARTEVLNSLDDVKFQSRDDDLYFGVTDDSFDISFGEDDSVENLIAREFATHHEDIGEVLRNIADIELKPKQVNTIVNRVIRENFGALDAETRLTLSTELQLALENVEKGDPAQVSNDMIAAVHKAIKDAQVTNERAEENYKDLLSVFKGNRYYLTDEQIADLKEHDMTLGDLRNKLFNKINIVSREKLDRSLVGGYQNAQELSLEGLYDVLEAPEEYLPYKRSEWDEYGYHAPIILMDTLDKLKSEQTVPLTDMLNDQEMDDLAVNLSAKLTGAIVEAKYNSKQNPYVSKLVSDLRQKRTEAIQKQKEKNKKKLAELKQKERERAAKREQELKDKHREQRSREREGRKRTELRGKIRKLSENMQKRLLHPKGQQYVPRQLIAQTVDVLNAIDLDTGRSTILSEKISNIRTQYDMLQKEERAYAMYDNTISEMLMNLSNELGDTAIMDMSLMQLKMAYDTLHAMDHVIRESVKMTGTEINKTSHQLGREMIAETRAVKGNHSGLLSGYWQTQLRPDVMFNRLAGFKKNSTWSQMARMLNDGQLKMTLLEMQFSMIFDELVRDTKQLKTLSDTKEKNMVDLGLVDDDGNHVKITRGMMLSLYMHLLNEDNTRHVLGGGLTVPGMKSYYKGDLAKAYGKDQLSVRAGDVDFTQYVEGMKSRIEEEMTEYEAQWIMQAQEFFDVASRNALNDTTMQLYGYKCAKVDHYFPIHTDSNYRAADFESISRDMSLENSGFMKERVKASNPILLEDITDVINDQIKKVSKYCGLTIPINNFKKVYGTTTPGFETSVQKELNKKFSATSKNAGATKYIDNLITDLTPGRQTSEGFIAKSLSKARGNLAQATLTLNPRVAIAQSASYPTAAAVIGWKPLIKAMSKGLSSANRAEIAEVTPLLWKRTQGYSNIEVGDIKELRKQKHAIEGKFKKALGWIEFFDAATVIRLYYACQYYVDEQNPDLKRGTDAYKQRVAEVYNDVIEKTQPNYTVMQRPDILRNPNALVKSLTMFMTQRLQNFNILYDAVGTYNKYLSDFKAGINDVSAEDVKRAKTGLRRAIISQTVAAATIVGMKLLADVLLHSVNGYRDDDKELTAESLRLALMNNFADTIFGSVLFGSDLYSLLKSAISGERYYGISLSGVDSFTETLENITSLRKKVDVDSVNKAAKSVCQLLGIPLGNAEKIGMGVYNHIEDIKNGEVLSFEAGVDRTSKQNVHRIEMLFEDDSDKAKKIFEEMIADKMSKGKTETEAKQALRSSFTSTYKPQYLEAVRNNDQKEIQRIRKLLLFTGLYGSLSDQDKAMEKWREDINK